MKFNYIFPENYEKNVHNSKMKNKFKKSATAKSYAKFGIYISNTNVYKNIFLKEKNDSEIL